MYCSGLEKRTINSEKGTSEAQEKTEDVMDFKTDEEKQKERENQKRATKFGMIFMASLIGIGGVSFVITYGPEQLDDDGVPVKDEFSELPLVTQYLKRSYKEIILWNKDLKEPSQAKVLPERLQYPYIQPDITVVVELKHVLLSPQWSYQNGWRFKRRPGLDYFLNHVGFPHCELVVVTEEAAMTVAEVINRMDSSGHIMYRLFRDSLRYEHGKHYKDFSVLNRDPSKVILVDWDGTATTSPENTLVLPRWQGDSGDQDLLKLADLLRLIIDSNPSDVRPVLRFYRDHPDPLQKFEQLRLEALEKERALEEARKAKAAPGVGGPAGSYTPGWLRGWV